MKITPATGEDVSEIDGLSLTVKILPDGDGGVLPVFFISFPSDDYNVSVEGLNCLISGLELAIGGVDSMISSLLKSLKDSSLKEMKSMFSPDGPVEIESILKFISKLEKDDEDTE